MGCSGSHDSHSPPPAWTVARDAARRTRRPGRAWFAYSAEIVIDSGGHKNTVSMRFEVLRTKFRMSTKADVAGAPLDMYMIIDSAAGTFTTVMPAQSMVNVASSSMLNDPAAAGYSMELAGVQKFDVVDLGAGEP